MPKLTKEQRQVGLLVAVVAVIAGVLVWLYGGVLLPKPTGDLQVPPPPVPVVLPRVNEAALYERDDFQSLRRFGEVPVVPRGPSGSSDPFAAAATGQ